MGTVLWGPPPPDHPLTARVLAKLCQQNGWTFLYLKDVKHLAAALRLPTARIGQQPRLKRAVLVIGPDRVVRHAIFPVTDIAAAVGSALEAVAAVR